ncbi:MAG: hypothetical protein F6K50_12330 [Moorea sp. SIO3I7]|uniref:hypothetical protein n=1 Tax=Moorena sp. SIO3I8 TaxID=2607833 RepID=UPI0013C105E3|nr:hypothetical protein [Moorena sp. SIO3I8]NEN96293.1 hypothetical protein [Moorena sp. SIO3I7]NEO04871.1 hypothetical protein [Moorena sp. SIO3I8]
MKNEEFTRYFVENLPDKVYRAVIKLCDRFLEKRRSLSYEQHLIAFASFEQFLRAHTIPYSIPRSFEYSGSSTYQREEAIVDFFRTIKQTIQSLPWSEQSKLREQSLISTWKQKQNLQPKQELNSLSQDALLRLIQEKDNLINLLIRQVETALQRPSFYAENYHNEGNTMSEQRINNDLSGAKFGGGFANRDQHGGTFNDYSKDHNLTEAAAEIQQLLEQLSQTNPTSTNAEKMAVVAKAVDQIEDKPTLKQRMINVLKTGGTEAFKEAVDHPLVNVLLAAIEGWQEGS